MRFDLNYIYVLSLIAMTAGCDQSSAKIENRPSVGELSAARESIRAEDPKRETRAEAEKRRLTRPESWKKATPPEFLLSRQLLVEWQEALAGATVETLTREQSKLLSEVHDRIARSVGEELNTGSPDNPFDYHRVHPLRASILLTWYAHAGIDIDGITGYFGNAADEAPLAADAFELLGMTLRAQVIREAMALWPPDAPLDAYPAPIEDAAYTKLDELELRFWDDELDPYHVCALFALNHPEYFFDLSSD